MFSSLILQSDWDGINTLQLAEFRKVLLFNLHHYKILMWQNFLSLFINIISLLLPKKVFHRIHKIFKSDSDSLAIVKSWALSYKNAILNWKGIWSLPTSMLMLTSRQIKPQNCAQYTVEQTQTSKTECKYILDICLLNAVHHNTREPLLNLKELSKAVCENLHLKWNMNKGCILK